MITKKKIIVNVSDAKISSDNDTVIVTHSLGSCIGLSLYDTKLKLAGMLHFQLPSSKDDPQKAAQKPLMFADTGTDILLKKLISLGAAKNRLQVKITGAAAMKTGPKGFDIGKRNHTAIRKIFWKKGILIDAEDIGGNQPRNMYIDVSNGKVMVKKNGIEKIL
jgi:chemotaxis protein CheD